MHRDKAILSNLINELRERKGLKFDTEQTVSLEAEYIEKIWPKSKIFIEEIEKWDFIPEMSGYYIRVELNGKIPIDKFDEYKLNIVEVYQNIFRKNKVSEGEISLRLKGIGLLIPPIYYKSAYTTFQKFMDKYELQIKSAAQRRKAFSHVGSDIQVDIEFPFGEKLLGVSFYKRHETILENAHLLTKIAVKYILNGYYLKGKELLQATKKTIEEDIEFFETEKNQIYPRYRDLIMYAKNYNDKIVISLVNKKPPIIDYDMNQCVKYYMINNKYLKFTKESGTLCSFGGLLNIKNHLRDASNFNEFRSYLYIYKTILLTMGIDEDYLDELLFSIKFFFD